MARLKNYNGRYCESDYENAFISFLEAEGWQYLAGDSMTRESMRDVLYADDLEQFLHKTNGDLDPDEVRRILDTIRLAGAESDFATLHKVYGWMVDGISFTPKDGRARMVALIDFDSPEPTRNNIFRVVNQFSVEYTNNGQTETRRPDVLLYVNGLPLCVIELKNPADARATILDAWEQINVRYWRDIPHLLHYCPLACISDGVKTRLGTVQTPYEHFYAWRRVNDGDKLSTLPFEETETMVKGVYSPARFLEIFRDYIHFQDSQYDGDEKEIVCRYPQFFATRLLKQSIVKSVQAKNGKGGTYFGATGCGKTYTMAFLARQLALRCADVPGIGSPTIVVIVDRDDLQKQGAKLFTRSKEFLNLGEVGVVPSRSELRKELGKRKSGGFYICTIQKFCDRKDDKVGLVNDRANIICFSDEAHRTQLEHSKKIKFSKDADENMRAMISKPYAKVLREAFPHATFVGFTGTPPVRRGRPDRLHQVPSENREGPVGPGEGAADRGVLQPVRGGRSDARGHRGQQEGDELHGGDHRGAFAPGAPRRGHPRPLRRLLRQRPGPGPEGHGRLLQKRDRIRLAAEIQGQVSGMVRREKGGRERLRH